MDCVMMSAEAGPDGGAGGRNWWWWPGMPPRWPLAKPITPEEGGLTKLRLRNMSSELGCLVKLRLRWKAGTLAAMVGDCGGGGRAGGESP